MIRKIFIALLIVISCTGLKAQYITEVMEYRPAPGQFINSMPWGCPFSAYSLEGGINGSTSLGAFGGYVVFRFAVAVENHPDNPYGIDFSIFGNPSSEWSEPGVVWVMKDENENGMADETWYELAGSDYYFSSTLKDYEVWYFNPGGQEAVDVPWTDLWGDSGSIRANSTHSQPYYPLLDSFPEIPADSFALAGTCILGIVDLDHPPEITSLRRAFGYADNRVRGPGAHTLPDNPYTPEMENSGGDAFDIDWAVDRDGNAVNLDLIHFVKVQNGLMHEGGWLGELSTEITGAVDVPPNAGIDGNLDLLVMKELPFEMDTGYKQLELFLFHKGKPVALPQIQWTLSEDWATVDEDAVLRVSDYGPLTISASVIGESSLQATISTLVRLDTSTIVASVAPHIRAEPLLYPNPATASIRITGIEENSLLFFDMTGRLLRRLENYIPGDEIHIHDFPRGMYLLRIGEGSQAQCLKFLKE